MIGTALWRRPDVVLALLVTFATLAACAVLTLTLLQIGAEPMLAFVVTVCSRTLSETVTHRADLGRLLLYLPLGVGLTLAISEALRLLFKTWRSTAVLAPHRCMPTGRLRRLMRKCALARNTVLVRTDQPLVFTHGLLIPKVWLSTGLMRVLRDDELEAVLYHEAYHLRVRDPLKMLVVHCLSRALFFAPVARDLCDTYSTAKELAADAYATRTMGDALPLARALRKLIAARPAVGLSAALVGETSITETRLLALLDPAHPLPYLPMKHLGLSLLWLLVFAAVLFAPAAGHMPSVAECAAPSALFKWIRHWPL